MKLTLVFFLSGSLLGLTGCQRAADSAARGPSQELQSTARADSVFDPCTLALAPVKGATPLDQEISRLQERIRQSAKPADLLERLGWLYVSKARGTFDPGFYKLAEQTALCLEAKRPGAAEAQLLRGHVLHNLHRFHEAERVAGALVRQRGLPFDFGLWGDTLMELGRLDEAIAAYQKMMDLKPDLHAYARAAHARWLKGDTEGAIEAMRLAAAAASPRDAESAAWVYARLGFLQLHAGQLADARQSCLAASDFLLDYAPALLVLGRVELAEGRGPDAIPALERAVARNPLPEALWLLAEAYRMAGRTSDATPVEARLRTKGVADDPRTAALFFATRAESAEAAVRLAERELQERADVFTHDAVAWALAAAGRWEAAQHHIEKALSEGTADARLFLHAGVIAAHTGQPEAARDWLAKAQATPHALLPSERDVLARATRDLTALPATPVQTAAAAGVR